MGTRMGCLAVLLALAVAGCVTPGAMREMSSQELGEKWRTGPAGTRTAIVKELERRKAVDALVGCLTLTGSGIMTRRTGFSVDDIIALVLALGRVGRGNPYALDAVLYVNDMENKALELALLEAYAGLEGARAARATLQYLREEDQEVHTIFRRIRAERLIFIADTCYSGASGGRSMLAAKTRAALSEGFFDRISTRCERARPRESSSWAAAGEASEGPSLLLNSGFLLVFQEAAV